jgi:hypothetical protein
VSCMTITFATANRASLAKLAPREMEEELGKAPPLPMPALPRREHYLRLERRMSSVKRANR